MVCGQAVKPGNKPIRLGDVLRVTGGAAVFLSPHVLHINDSPPPCAPCSRTEVPFFDRWAIRVPIHGLSAASTYTLGVLALATFIDLGRQENGVASIAASLESASMALGTAELLKAIIDRKRPVLYTVQAPTAGLVLENQRSFPSGHSAAAFALATSYWLRYRDLHPHVRRWEPWVAAAGAVTVGTLRVVSGKHFPSDVAAGALLGATSAVVIHAIKF